MAAFIVESLEELERQPYWKLIQYTTEKRLAGVIERGLGEGESPSAMANRVQEAMGGETSRKRAANFARTETTGAMNAGHEAAYEDLAADGSISGRDWNAILDRKTRTVHRRLEGTYAAAPYPGHWSLPAEQRALCRCTTLGVLAIT